MDNFIVQFRREPNGRLEFLMNCNAKSRVHAIVQGARVFINGGEDVCESDATASNDDGSRPGANPVAAGAAPAQDGLRAERLTGRKTKVDSIASFERVPAHQDSDSDFNAKAPLYQTAYFASAAHELNPGLPVEPVRVVFVAEEFNHHYGVSEPLFRVYRTQDDSTLVGHYFARALKDFVL